MLPCYAIGTPMKKYAFPFTLAAVCFLGGYALNLGERQWLQSQLESARVAYGELVDRYEHHAFALAAAHRENVQALIPHVLKDWNQGLVAPVIPPKVVAP